MHFNSVAAKWLRRRLLARARKLTPGPLAEKAAVAALGTARWAASCSSAYRQLLAEHGVEAVRIPHLRRLDELPVLTKANTFGRFALSALARDVPLSQLADVVTSSGRSGASFGFRLTGRAEHERSWFGIDLGLEDAFEVDSRPTLLINCLPMGVVFRSRAVTVANVSVRADMACAIARDVGSRYAQTILCTDPVFMRALLDEADAVGLDWKALNASVIVGEEPLAETQRTYFARRMQIELDAPGHRIIASSFGVGELGLNLMFESRATIQIRRAARTDLELARLLDGVAADDVAHCNPPLVFCYNPFRVCVEVLKPDALGFGELCFTMLGRSAIIPLPRFATGDVGRLLTAQQAGTAARLARVNTPSLPLVLLRGTQRHRSSGHPTAESVKSWLYEDADVADHLTGVFILDQDSSSRPMLQVQTSTTTAAHDGALLLRLQLEASSRWPALKVQLVDPFAFPGRPVVDYERKPRYQSLRLDR